MIIGIIALLIGLLIAGAGIYYLIKEAHDPESKKIYSVITAAGVIIAAGTLAKLFIIG